MKRDVQYTAFRTPRVTVPINHKRTDQGHYQNPDNIRSAKVAKKWRLTSTSQEWVGIINAQNMSASSDRGPGPIG